MARSVLGGRLRVARDMLDAEDMEGIEPVDNGGVTSGKPVTLGAQDSQPQQSTQPQLSEG